MFWFCFICGFCMFLLLFICLIFLFIYSFSLNLSQLKEKHVAKVVVQAFSELNEEGKTKQLPEVNHFTEIKHPFFNVINMISMWLISLGDIYVSDGSFKTRNYMRVLVLNREDFRLSDDTSLTRLLVKILNSFISFIYLSSHLYLWLLTCKNVFQVVLRIHISN